MKNETELSASLARLPDSRWQGMGPACPGLEQAASRAQRFGGSGSRAPRGDGEDGTRVPARQLLGAPAAPARSGLHPVRP